MEFSKPLSPGRPANVVVVDSWRSVLAAPAESEVGEAADSLLGRTADVVARVGGWVPPPPLPPRPATPGVKLYYVNGSIPSWRVLMALYQLGELSLGGRGSTHTSRYRRELVHPTSPHRASPRLTAPHRAPRYPTPLDSNSYQPHP